MDTISTTCDFINTLPNELLEQIFHEVTDFSIPPPSITKFKDEPSSKLTHNEEKSIKSMASVCPRWRALLLNEVFKYARVSLDCQPRWLGLSAALGSYLRSLHNISPRLTELLEQIQARQSAGFNILRQGWSLLDLQYMEDDGDDAMLLPQKYHFWVPSSRGNVMEFLAFITRNQLQCKIQSLVVYTEQSISSPRQFLGRVEHSDRGSTEETAIIRELSTLWRVIFQDVDLSRITIAAPPSTMAFLASSAEDSSDTWAFDMPMHYLSFSRELTEILPAPSTTKQANFKESGGYIYGMRPWTSISYNEGCMISGYAHYEWQWKKPPRIFYHLLRWVAKNENQTRLSRSPILRDITYISLFPYAGHVELIMQTMAELHALRHLAIKFANPDLLDNPERLGKGQRDDIWGAWEECHGYIYRWLLNRNSKVGTEFVSIDARLETQKETITKALPLHQTVAGRQISVLRKEEEPTRWIRVLDPNFPSV
ncbi:hypothetical protein EJ08DRAFT_327136 [Tothia fuscella]|uniref:F-box domain-containing protein n=1 Tax=Tothia fuscella TaxID=1048955 RepID=A0A9P4NNS8_9PEZI|nr:hypothetical protein EJ08DRAFT_327136 [Tothia fuscella]